MCSTKHRESSLKKENHQSFVWTPLGDLNISLVAQGCYSIALHGYCVDATLQAAHFLGKKRAILKVVLEVFGHSQLCSIYSPLTVFIRIINYLPLGHSVSMTV